MVTVILGSGLLSNLQNVTIILMIEMPFWFITLIGICASAVMEISPGDCRSSTTGFLVAYKDNYK